MFSLMFWSNGDVPKLLERLIEAGTMKVRTYYVQSSEKLPICTDSLLALTFESNTMVCAADPTLTYAGAKKDYG